MVRSADGDSAVSGCGEVQLARLQTKIVAKPNFIALRMALTGSPFHVGANGDDDASAILEHKYNQKIIKLLAIMDIYFIMIINDRSDC